jgi:hypothetical protein
MGTTRTTVLGLRIVLAAAHVAACALAQGDAWRLPPLGAVEYRREWRGAASEPVRTRAQAKAAPATAKLPDRYLHRVAPAPWICQGELRGDQKAIAGPVRDLRDVLRALAADLGNRSAVRMRFPRLVPFGDIVVSGAWSTLAPDGAQTLRATMTASAIAAQPGEPRDTAERLRASCVADADGTIVLQRRLDVAAGLLRSFDGTIDLAVDEGDKTSRRLVVADRFDLVAVRENQDADFRARVATAIRDGAAWVRDQIDEQKSFFARKGGDDRDYSGGRLALALLTLLHGHVPPDDAVVQRGFADLRKRRLEDTYSLAAALMAVAALYTPPAEAARLRDGALAQVPRKQLPERDRDVAAKWLARLLDNVDPRGKALDVLRFNYTAGPRYDTSLQQYGLLGMWAAHTCGLELPAGAFGAAARHLLDVQAPPGGTLTLRLCSYAQLRDAAGTDAPPRATEQRAQARGFAYQDACEAPFGSMTSAGVSGLLLARAGSAARGEQDRALAGRVDDAIGDGYAWIADEFSVRCNPGFAERADHHWYYWLYCLERCCELAGIARLHGRDWYYEGGLQLLSQQQRDGSFRAEQQSTLLLEATCFAVLFLAKATAAAPITGR